MKILKKRKQRNRGAEKKDPEKERVFRLLVDILTASDYVVRREKLKQGLGWKAISGACQLESDKLIFVDRRMPQDDQIDFLVSKVQSLGLDASSASLQDLPEKLFDIVVSQKV